MRKSLVFLLLLLIIGFGLIGLLQNPSDHDVKIEHDIIMEQQL